MTKKQKKTLTRIIITCVIMLALSIFDEHPILDPAGFIRLPAYLVPYIIIGHDIIKKAFKGILNGQVFDENFLMAIATIGAFGLGIMEGGDYVEAVSVMLLYQIGEFFQSYAVGKSRNNISELMDIRPDYANIERDGELIKVDPDEVSTGSIITIQPGEKIPIDGIVKEGHTVINTVALTGESIPFETGVGDAVMSGCINVSGLIKVETTREFGESTASKILELMEESSMKKSRSEQFISRFASVYTPIVCVCALLLAVVPPLFLSFILHKEPMVTEWIYRSLTFLVISCPCALVISIPLSFFAGIGGASREGILIKGSVYLEALSKVKTLAFDKTGTVTKGVFEVDDIHHSNIDKEKLIEIAALVESASSHPISRSLQKAMGKPIDRTRVSDIEEIAGEGVKGKVDGISAAAGNILLMQRLNVVPIECHTPGTIIHMAVGGEYGGHIVISDKLKEGAVDAMQQLKKSGIKKLVMLTGDQESIAQRVGKELGIDDIRGGLLPKDKVAVVEELMASQTPREKLAFVGDGINDAPVLSRADVGIAMGALGSDAAIEAADIVLMDDDPMKISKAVRISRKCLSIVYQNIAFAIGIKIICLILGAFGYANMWLAIFADTGVMILAVINAIRALFVKNL